MLLHSRFRCFRFTLFFARSIIFTALLYSLLNVLTDTLNHYQQQKLHDDNQFADITNTNSSTQHPIPIPSSLVRKIDIPETMESFTKSDSEDAAIDNGRANSGAEQNGRVGARTVIKAGDVEQRVRREVIRLRLRPPKSVQYSHGQWQTVDVGRHVYIYSAFYDSRPEIDWPQVRIVAVAEFDVELYGLCCLLWYRSQRLPDVAEMSFVQAGQTSSPDGRTILEQFIFSCRVDLNKTDTPTSVSVVGPHNFRLSTLLLVQVPERPKHVIEFGHCMSIRYWQQDPFQLVEWLEAHRMLGVGEVNIYTAQIDNVTDSILTRYSDEGFVNYRQSPGPIGDYDEHAILLAMSPVINDCMYRNLYRYRYVVCTDLDEMIVPASPHHNYSEMLTAAAAAAAAPTNAVIHSYVFRNTYFFLDFGATEKEPWYLLTQRYTMRVRPSRFGYSAKSVTRTLSCIALQNHLCWKSLPSYTGQPNWNVDVPVDIGKSQHYKRCHFDKFLRKNGVCHRMMTRGDVKKDRAMLRFRDKLANVVSKKLLELDLIKMTEDGSWKWKKSHGAP